MAGFLIPPWYKSFWYFLTLIIFWTIKTQCLMQILTNRISLILYNPEKARKLKLYIFLAIGVINVSVFIVWIPARLQLSEKWIRVLLIGSMSLPDDVLYVQVHPLAYMTKLYIEMNIAEFLGKILKQPNRRHNSFSLSNDCHNPTTRNGRRPDIEATGNPISNREWRNSKHQFHVKPSGGQMHPLNMDLLTGGEKSHDRTNKWGRTHGAGLYDVCAEKEDEVGEPSTPSEVHVKDSSWPMMEVKRRSSSSEEMRQPRRVRPGMQRAETSAGYDDGDDNSRDTTGDGWRANRCLSQDHRSSRHKRDSGVETDMDTSTDGLMQGAIPPTKTYSDHEEGR
ncbi:hypothetical protein B0H65DRAFT_432770 [Neurospora tetraspora]|uniref:Uncharacterized protein n=1 Tax=Neurospora tetraspora TaxID=94610 RepID=A0AAE0MPP4_9PEZI|nr:hypothetical protein B0H65DRAFT_432770 [Neurospora tetraspora]